MKHQKFLYPSCFLLPGYTTFAANDLLDVSTEDMYEEHPTEFRNKLRLGRFAERQVAFHLMNAAKQHDECVLMSPFSQHGHSPIKTRDIFVTKNRQTYAIEVKTTDRLNKYPNVFVDSCGSYEAKLKTARVNSHIPLCTVVVGSQVASGEYQIVVVPDSTIDSWIVKPAKHRREYLSYLCPLSRCKTFTQLCEWLYPTHETDFGK